jgi:hypothetical protein
MFPSGRRTSQAQHARFVRTNQGLVERARQAMWLGKLKQVERVQANVQHEIQIDHAANCAQRIERAAQSALLVQL